MILIRNADHIVTMDDPDPDFGPGDVLIDGARIAGVFSPQAADRLPPEGIDHIIDATGMVVIPGLINTHHHVFQTLTRNLPAAQEAELFDWLVRHYPVWQGFTGEMVEVSARAAFGELLLSGCTCTTDHHYLFPAGAPGDLIDRQVKAAIQAGIRFHPTRGSMEMGWSRGGLPPDDLVEDRATILDDCRRLIDTMHDPAPLSMCRLALAPCAPFNVSEELMRETADLARQHELRLHTHLGETVSELEYCLKQFGCRPLEHARRLGWLEGDVWLAHAVCFDDAEIGELARAGVAVAHCPSSNLRLGSGIAPVRKMLDAGVTVGLGVDGSASNDSSNLLGEVHQTLLVHRTSPVDQWLTAREVLGVATRGGAATLGRDDIGIVRPGMAADVVIVDFDQLGYAGSKADPLSAIVFNLPLRPVHTTIVNGQVVVTNGELVTIDEMAVAREAHHMTSELLSRARP